MPASSNGAFDEAERIRQNQEWYANERATQEHKRAVHNAICDVQGKTPAQQREWLNQQQDSSLICWVLKYLHPVVQLEVIRAEEEKALSQADEMQAELEARPRKVSDVETFLRNALSQGHSVPAKEILEMAATAGISNRTLYRAKANLRIQTDRVGFGPGGHFVWFLPPENP